MTMRNQPSDAIGASNVMQARHAASLLPPTGISGGRARNSRIELRYGLGDFCFFRKAFDARLETLPFHPEAPALIVPPESPAMPDGIAVRCYQGQRLAHSLRALHFRRQGFWYIRNQTVNYYI